MDVRAIRERTGLSQEAFARAYRIDVMTLRGWEQGRRTATGAAAAYLQVIAWAPVAVRRLWEKRGVV